MKFTVQAASRATGISTSRLRTWERRYGIPAPARSDTGRRLYDDDDLALIRRIAALVDAGVPARHAAGAVLAESRGADRPQPNTTEPETHPLALSIVRVAEQYEDGAVTEVIHAAVAELRWTAALEHVLFPSLALVGERWQRGELALSAEHFISAIVRRELMAGVDRLPQPAAQASLLVIACPEDERHDLGATALWLLLREAGLRVVFLGADVPSMELILALRRTDADAVLLSATAPTSVPTLGLVTRAIASARVRARIFVGGPALAYEDPIAAVAGIRLPPGLADAADLLIRELTSGE